MNNRGQALIESIPFFLFLFGLMVLLLIFTQWFLIHQKLLIAAREGAMLYSSGRQTKLEVDLRIRAYLEQGSLALPDSHLAITIGRFPGAQAHLFFLDEVKIQFTPTSWLQRYFSQTMEEKCVIKHAPSYGVPYQPLYGPPEPW